MSTELSPRDQVVLAVMEDIIETDYGPGDEFTHDEIVAKVNERIAMMLGTGVGNE